MKRTLCAFSSLQEYWHDSNLSLSLFFQTPYSAEPFASTLWSLPPNETQPDIYIAAFVHNCPLLFLPFQFYLFPLWFAPLSR